MRKVKLVFASFVVVCMLIVKLKMGHKHDCPITGSQDSAISSLSSDMFLDAPSPSASGTFLSRSGVSFPPFLARYRLFYR